MTIRHPGISPTNDLVAKKIFSNPEITCQFIRDMLDLPAKNVTILEGSNIHVLPSLPYSAQDFYTSIDVLAELDNGTQVIIEIQVHHQNFFINRLWAYLCSQVNQNLEKIRQREGDTHQSYKHIAPVYAIAIVDSNYFSDDLAFHSFSMREDTTGEVLTITNNGQENHLVKMAFLELKKYRETSKDEVRKPWLEFFGNKPFLDQMVFLTVSVGLTTTLRTQRQSCPIAHSQPQMTVAVDGLDLLNLLLIPLQSPRLDHALNLFQYLPP